MADLDLHSAFMNKKVAQVKVMIGLHTNAYGNDIYKVIKGNAGFLMKPLLADKNNYIDGHAQDKVWMGLKPEVIRDARYALRKGLKPALRPYVDKPEELAEQIQLWFLHRSVRGARETIFHSRYSEVTVDLGFADFKDRKAKGTAKSTAKGKDSVADEEYTGGDRDEVGEGKEPEPGENDGGGE